MKGFTFQKILLSSATLLTTSFAVNFNPSTGLTDYPSVEISITPVPGYDNTEIRTMTVPLQTVKKFGFDMEAAEDPISEELFQGLDLPPSVVILSGEASVLDISGHPEFAVLEAEITREPNDATGTVCKFILSEDVEDEYRDLKFGFRLQEDNGGVMTGIYCTVLRHIYSNTPKI